jgi:hypothetical protein
LILASHFCVAKRLTIPSTHVELSELGNSIEWIWGIDEFMKRIVDFASLS